MFKFWLAALGCVSVYVAQGFAGEATPGGGSLKLTLDQAITLALDASPGLRARHESEQAAAAGLRQSDTGPNPEISVELENFGVSGRFSGLDESELTIGLTQRFERDGKREGRIAVARTEKAAAALERERTKLDVIYDVRIAYSEIAVAQLALDHARSRTAGAIQLQSLAARRVSAARDPLTVSLRADIAVEDGRAAQRKAEHELDIAVRKLAQLIGKPDARIEITAAPMAKLAKTTEPDGTGPDVQAREIMVRRASAQLALEQANAKTDPTVGVGVRRFQDGGDVAGVVSFSMPLTLHDDNSGNIDKAAAQRRVAEFEAEEARKRFRVAILKIQGEIEHSDAELRAVRTAMLPRAVAAMTEARRGFQAGAFSYQEISEAQRLLTELREREVAALRSLYMAQASLDRLTGGSQTKMNVEESK
jgi:outer membrane protein, heavy metal efflux system